MFKLAKKNLKSYEDIHYSCTIRYLDDTEPLTVTYQKENKGQWLLDHVCRELNLMEKDYFGLRYVDPDKQRHWLDPTKTIYRQLKNVFPVVLCFRVKFYPSDPMKLKEEITRYLVFLQLRRDLHHGRLLCSPTDANEMAGYIIQSEVGDYDPLDHDPDYISSFKMLPKQTVKQEEKIAEFHKKFKGQVPSEAEANFLKKAVFLETYGVDPHPVKDQKGNQMYLGVTHLGIVTFQGNKRTHLFKWVQITKIAFEGKMFIVHVIISEKKHACGFKCATFSACKHLWKCAVEQQYFFTLSTSSEAKKATSGGSFFSRGSKFRFSGRCQKEVIDGSMEITREEPKFVRSSSNPLFVRSFGNLQSVTLPNKFRERNSLSEMRNMSMDGSYGNHSMLDSLLVTSTPLEDHLTDTIPEEVPSITLGDSPYRPVHSPSTEEFPSFPSDQSSLHPEPLVLPPCVPPDLDAQIQELQRELENCRYGNNDTELPIACLLESAEHEVVESCVVEAAIVPANISTPVDRHTEPNTISSLETREVTPSKPRSVLHVLLLCLLSVLLVALILAVLVLESDLQVAGLGSLRQLPEVQHFKYYTYTPLKTSASHKLGMSD